MSLDQKAVAPPLQLWLTPAEEAEAEARRAALRRLERLELSHFGHELALKPVSLCGGRVEASAHSLPLALD